jgi:hypothetical protein
MNVIAEDCATDGLALLREMTISLLRLKRRVKSIP